MIDAIRDPQAIHLAYLVAAAMFIIGMRRLGSPVTARSGNRIAGIGMLIGLIATLLDQHIVSYGMIAVGVLIGTVLGTWSARAVKMTAMPQMVALFNGLGGGCVALIALAEYNVLSRGDGFDEASVLLGIVAGAIIGAISFSGSVIAFVKLQELITGRPITWPGQTLVNAVIALVTLGIGVHLMLGENVLIEFSVGDETLMIAMVALAFLLGMLFVLPVGGADMPVIISLLNSFTGLAAAMAGIALDNNLLIIAGIIVGASGFLLTKMMGEAMNRPISNVLFGAFGGGGGGSGSGAAADGGGTVRTASTEDVAIMLAYSRSVVIVPGYGLAVAQAQHTARELADHLGERGVTVRYGIHPVAGRMPGHMNVLLAEADVPYDQLKEMDEINPEFRQTDVVLVIGANDVVNPAAKEEPSSPLYGMPILNVDEAQAVVVMKRSMNTGFAGVENPLFTKPNTQMLFGDAKATLNELVGAVREA